LKTLAELEIDDEMDLNELDLESSAESQSISSTETPNEQTNERKSNRRVTFDFDPQTEMDSIRQASSLSINSTSSKPINLRTKKLRSVLKPSGQSL